MKRFIHLACLLLTAGVFTGCKGNLHANTPLYIAALLITLITALFLGLAFYSNVLRDEVNDTEEFTANTKKLAIKQNRKFVNSAYPFSLTKVQFGVWTVIIASAYIYLSLCKGDCSEGPVNKTALVLMGVFAGTAVASTIMDKKEITDNRPRHQNSPSEGFFIDILSDDNGISLHRFQNFVWTIIAMTIYIYKVVNTVSGCVLPELSDTLLTLTGISSATYLVLRSQENNQEAQPAEGSPVNDPGTQNVSTSGSVVTVTDDNKQPVTS